MTDRRLARRILVVEDDPIAQKVMVDYLSAHGFRVSLAKTGPEGIEKALIIKPDLVLCDVALPQKNGFEVCFEIKHAPETRDVPVILMSAVCKDGHSRKHAAELKAQGYFEKPFVLAEMLARIQELLGP